MAAKDGFKPSPDQQAVIDYRGGHLIVVASAGAGKTEAVSRRIVSLLEEGVAPSGIVAFTFTEKAAAGLKTRIYKRTAQRMGEAVLEKLGPLYVGTIHAYCLRILQEEVPRYAAFDMMDEHRLSALLSREFKNMGMHDLESTGHWKTIQTFMSNAGVVENELIPVEEIGDNRFAEVYAAYLDMLDRYRVFTFGQLITRVVEALQDPKIFKRVHGPIKHLIVDEYQDVNPAQEMLVELLSATPVQVCVVGDDDQAIYQWRGSSVDNFINFEKKYDAHRIDLKENRRSLPRIIERANTFASSIAPRIPKTMESVRTGKGPQFHPWSADNPEEEAEIIATLIKGLHKRGYRYRDIAILLRSVRTSSNPFVTEFEKKRIPFQCAGRTGLFLQPEAQVLGMTMGWLCDNNEWRSYRYGQPRKVDIDVLLKEYKQTFSVKNKALTGLKEYLEKWKEQANDDSVAANLIEEYYRLLLKLGVQKWDFSDPVIASRAGVLARFSEMLADYENSRRRSRWVNTDDGPVFRGGTQGGKWYYIHLFTFIQWYCLEAFEDFDSNDQFEVDAVNISTVHQAKGLEWPVVFVPALVKGRFPSSMTGREGTWWVAEKRFPYESQERYQGTENDERRLFFVAITRARDMLYPSRFKAMKNKKGNSLFLGEVAKGDPEVQWAEDIPLPPPYTPNTQFEDDRPIFSFSDLARYERCPYAYKLSALFGFQPPLVEEMGYGKAIHHVLRRVADYYKDNKKIPDAKAVARILDEEFFIPHARKPAYDALRESAEKLVHRYLGDYSDDLKRIWETERAFELQLDESVVIGRADVILDQGKKGTQKLAIVDYKTATAAVSDDVFAFQLAVYTAAARGEGLTVEAAYLHDLKSAERKPVSVTAKDVNKARSRADELAKRIVDKDFTPCPGAVCRHCDVKKVCGYGE